jgi:hypothetical protein
MNATYHHIASRKLAPVVLCACICELLSLENCHKLYISGKKCGEKLNIALGIPRSK